MIWWDFSIQFHRIDFLMRSTLWFWNGNIVILTKCFQLTCLNVEILCTFPMLAKYMERPRRQKWSTRSTRTTFFQLYRDRCHAIFFKQSMLFGNRFEGPELVPTSVPLFPILLVQLLNVLGPKSSKKYWNLQPFLFLRSDTLAIKYFISGGETKGTLHPSSFTRRFLSTSGRTGGSHHQWTVGLSCWFQTSDDDIQTPWSLRLRLSGLQSRCHLISRYSYPNSESPSLIHSLNLLYGAKGFSISDCYRAKNCSTGRSAVVCESNSVPKRSNSFSDHWLSIFSSRGTQEAHRAVSNEALLVSSGYQSWSPWRTCICETVDKLLYFFVSQH